MDQIAFHLLCFKMTTMNRIYIGRHLLIDLHGSWRTLYSVSWIKSLDVALERRIKNFGYPYDMTAQHD